MSVGFTGLHSIHVRHAVMSYWSVMIFLSVPILSHRYQFIDMVCFDFFYRKNAQLLSSRFRNMSRSRNILVRVYRKQVVVMLMNAAIMRGEIINTS